jgi:hypothetical protein
MQVYIQSTFQPSNILYQHTNDEISPTDAPALTSLAVAHQLRAYQGRNREVLSQWNHRLEAYRINEMHGTLHDVNTQSTHQNDAAAFANTEQIKEIPIENSELEEVFEDFSVWSPVENHCVSYNIAHRNQHYISSISTSCSTSPVLYWFTTVEVQLTSTYLEVVLVACISSTCNCGYTIFHHPRNIYSYLVCTSTTTQDEANLSRGYTIAALAITRLNDTRSNRVYRLRTV